MPTLQEIAVEACSLFPGEPGKEQLGRSVALSGVTATTLTSTTGLLFGGLSEQAYAQKWVWRPGAANTTDTVRYSTAYAPDTGVITIVGNYTDTTVGTETAILSIFSPFEWRLAIDQAVRKTRELDTTIIPVRKGLPEHWIHELSWIETPSQIRDVGVTHSPWLTRNRYLQKRAPDTSGIMQPTDWTVTNNSDSSPYETTASTWRGNKYSYSITDGGTDPQIVQTIDVLATGVDDDSLVGETVGVYARARGTGTSCGLVISDGTNSNLATSTGTGEWEELTTSITVASEDSLAVALSVSSNATWLVGEIGMHFGSLNDAIRRDDYPVYSLPKNSYEFEQSGPLKIHNPYVGSPGSFVIKSERPFPGFDSTRLGTGAADTDSTDAPLTTVATGAIFYLFRGRYGGDASITREWEKKFDKLRQSHLAMKTDGIGFNMMGSPLAAPAGRVR